MPGSYHILNNKNILRKKYLTFFQVASVLVVKQMVASTSKPGAHAPVGFRSAGGSALLSCEQGEVRTTFCLESMVCFSEL
jgi:hypothetical protein